MGGDRMQGPFCVARHNGIAEASFFFVLFTKRKEGKGRDGF